MADALHANELSARTTNRSQLCQLTLRKLKSVTAYFLNLGRFVAGGVILPLGKWSDESEFLWVSDDCEGAANFTTNRSLIDSLHLVASILLVNSLNLI